MNNNNEVQSLFTNIGSYAWKFAASLVSFSVVTPWFINECGELFSLPADCALDLFMIIYFILPPLLFICWYCLKEKQGFKEYSSKSWYFHIAFFITSPNLRAESWCF